MWWLFFFLVFSEPTFGSHFDGGSIRWAPVNKNVTTSPVQIMITQTYTYSLSLVNCTVGSLIGTTIYGFNFSLWCTLNCGATSAGYVAPPVLGYCTGSNSALNLAFAQRTDYVNLTANDYFSISHSIPNTASQGFYRPLTLSSGGNDSNAQWNITASIDIRPRADNGLINTPLMANVISPYGIPYNITTNIVIPVTDVDGDNVRCRWSNSTLECGDVCFPRTIPASTILSSNCTLTITGNTMSGWYCASIQVEDFLNTSTSLHPMSSTVLQFLIYVYKSKNCSIPTLSSLSTCVGVSVGVPYVLTLTVINYCGSSSNISDIAVQAFTGVVEGPLRLITPNKTVYAMNVTYTPLPSQVGLQILCATAVDNSETPSNQYCVTFMVGSTVAPTCPGVTSTTTQTSTTSTSTANNEITSIAAVTSSESTLITSVENLQTSSTNYLAITSQTEKISSVTTTSVSSTSVTTTLISSISATNPLVSSTSVTTTTPTNWPLIGSIIGVISLLALLGSCCFCYHYLWSAAARRRRQQQEDKHRVRYQPVNEGVINLTKMCSPPKAYQLYDLNKNRENSSNNNKNPQRTITASSMTMNIIQCPNIAGTVGDELPKRTKSTLPLTRPVSKLNEDMLVLNISQLQQDNHSTTNSTSNINNTSENQVKSTRSVIRILSTKRCKTVSNEKKRQQPSSSNVLVTRIKK